MLGRSRWALACLLTAVCVTAMACTTGGGGGGGGGTPNQPPTGVASGTPTTGAAPLTVVFSSAGTSDSDGTIDSYSWNFGDATAPSGAPNPSHTYTAAG